MQLHLYVVDHCKDLVDVGHLLPHQLLQLLRLAVKPEMPDTVQQKALKRKKKKARTICKSRNVFLLNSTKGLLSISQM